MTERERLMQFMIDAKRNDPETKPWSEWLVDYLLEHGVIVPQMNVGDSVYVPLNNDSIITAKVNSMTIHGRSLFVYTAYTEHFLKKLNFYGTEIGNTVFLTYEEADAVLKEREQNVFD